MTQLRNLFIDFPIHFYGYDINEGSFTLLFFNYAQRYVNDIKIRIGPNVFLLSFHSKEQKLIATINMPKMLIDSKQIYIEEVNIEDLIYQTKDYEVVIMQAPISIYSHRPHHRLYQHYMAKQTGKQMKDVLFISQQYDHYWDCTCGTHNPIKSAYCVHCHNKKEDVLVDLKPFHHQSLVSSHIYQVIKASFIYLTVIYLFQIIFEALAGEFLFDNLIKNQFFGVLNRIVLPLILLLSLLGLWRSRFKMESKQTTTWLVLITTLFLYFNGLGVFYFIGSSYNHFFLIGLNTCVILIFVYTLFKRWKTNWMLPLMMVSLISMSLFAVKYQAYASLDLQVLEDGLHLTVTDDEERYVVPTAFEGVPVVEVTFSKSYDYEMTHLVISKNIRKIYFSSALVLEHLYEVSVDEDNQYFYVENNLLYTKDRILTLVPVHTEVLYVDDEIIMSGPFRDLIYLKQLTIGAHVEEIKYEAFINAYQLETLIFEDESQLKLIGDDAFANALNLKEINLPQSLEHLGIGIFRNAASLESLTAPFIGEEREQTNILYRSYDILVYFFGSKTYLHSHLIPETLKHVEFYDIDRIHNTTFYNASQIETIVFSSQLNTIGIRSFYGTTNLKSFIIPNGVTEIPESAFELSGIEVITIPASVTYIGPNAFKNTSLITVHYLGDVDDLTIHSTGNEIFITVLGEG